MLFAGRALRHHTQDQYARSLAATTSLVAEDIGHEIADHARALSQAAATLRATPMQAAALRANLERRAVLDGMFNEGVVVTNRRGEIITQLPVSTPSGSILTHGASVEQFAKLGDAAPLLWIDTESRSGRALLVLGALLEDASGAVVGSLLGSAVVVSRYVDDMLRRRAAQAGVSAIVNKERMTEDLAVTLRRLSDAN
ncbi:MAG: hypothetical protein ACOVN2_12375 [Usitatibacteraceae bacterium]|jgi:hypothetical protein